MVNMCFTCDCPIIPWLLPVVENKEMTNVSGLNLLLQIRNILEGGCLCRSFLPLQALSQRVMMNWGTATSSQRTL